MSLSVNFKTETKQDSNKKSCLLEVINVTSHTISSIIGYPGQVNKMCSNNFVRNRITTRKVHLFSRNLQGDKWMDLTTNVTTKKPKWTKLSV